MGVGSTGIAAKNTERPFIGIELDEVYFQEASSELQPVPWVDKLSQRDVDLG